MSEDLWTAVDDFLAGLLVTQDDALGAALADIAAAGLPAISVSPAQGKFLHLLARIQGPKNILEVGTLGGYSTIWLARALPPTGRLVTLEAEPTHAEVARRNIARAGLSGVVDLRLGPAIESLPTLEAEGAGPFDFAFIDADKASTWDYFQWALKLSRPGGVIVVDNVVRKGAVADPDNISPDVQGVRRFLEHLAVQPRVTATALQTVGSKGYDGFAIVLVNAGPPPA